VLDSECEEALAAVAQGYSVKSGDAAAFVETVGRLLQ
jgi:hypothetical protein